MFVWSDFLAINTYIFLGFTITVTIFYFVMFMFSFNTIKKGENLNMSSYNHSLGNKDYTKPVSILVPAFNEEAGVLQSIRSIISLDYPQVEIIIINDGSTDDTLKKIVEHFKMKPTHQLIYEKIKTKPINQLYSSTILSNLLLIDKVNGGKADALNAGINVSQYSYFCSIDGDSILEREALKKVMKPIMDSDGEVIATGGSVRIANNCIIQGGHVKQINLSKVPLVIYQVIEYLRAFLIGRLSLSKHNLMLIISGAFGVFSKQWVIKAGGYSVNTVGEDMELVVKLHKTIKKEKSHQRIVFVPDSICWTEAPEKFKYLARQRTRWHRGLIETLWQHKDMLFNPKYKSIGFISMPYYWFVEFLGPVIELWGYIFLILCFIYRGIYYEFTILLFISFLLYGSLITLFSVLLEEWNYRRYSKESDVFKLYFYALTEIIWFRPITVVWRINGIISFMFKKRSWGEMKRKGL